MYSVILCGGSGTRLWPLSRKNFPKQFLSLYNKNSLLQETFLRLKDAMPTQNIYFITNKENFYNVFNQIKDLDKTFLESQVLVEPASLNTAPAMTYAMKHLAEKARIDLDEPVIFLPADHYIGNKEKFIETIKKASDEVGESIGTIGIIPTKPETGYGYIKKGINKGKYFEVFEFKEKPNKDTAEEYLRSSEYLWNSGMYVFTIRTFVRELRMHAPEIYSLLVKSFEIFINDFKNLPSISIDYAISEKSNHVVVFEGDFGWNDIGSFDSLAEILKQEKDENHLNIDSRNVFVHSANNRLIVTLGLDDVNVVETSDSVLVYKKGRGEDVKKVVDHLKANNYKELEHNLIVHRPWGRYEILIDNPTHKVKKIVVKPGSKLSLQTHLHRVEHWVVIKGMAKVTIGEKEVFLKENESTFIPALTTHRLENPGKIDVEIIEVQTGHYLEEDDIIRHDDIYKRI